MREPHSCKSEAGPTNVFLGRHLCIFVVRRKQVCVKCARAQKHVNTSTGYCCNQLLYVIAGRRMANNLYTGVLLPTTCIHVVRVEAMTNLSPGTHF